MIAYPDTSFLVSLYVRQIHSPRAASHFAAMQEPLHVTDLVLYEFRLAVRLAVYRAEHGAPDVVTREDAASAFANLEFDLADGSLVLVAYEWRQYSRPLSDSPQRTGWTQAIERSTSSTSPPHSSSQPPNSSHSTANSGSLPRARG